jgi:peptidoglycan/LPS O-acetylase OafA/YrhL
MKLREIERLRAVAILMVMVVHWDCFARLLPEAARQSWSGVDVFFVISGYVVSLSLLRLLPSLESETSFLGALDAAKHALKTFYARRFFRIMPAALAVLVLHRVLISVIPGSFGTPKLWFAEFVDIFSGVYNYALPYHGEYRMGVYWSLAVEEHFYLVLPVLFVAFRTKTRRLGACVVIALVCILARALPNPDGVGVSYYERFSSHLRFDSLMAGVVLALASDGRPTPAIMPRWLMRFVVLPICVVLIACMPNAAPEHVVQRIGFISLWFLSGILVFFAAKDAGYVFAFPGIGRVLEYIGSRSYGLYLTHVTVIRAEGELRRWWPPYNEWVPNPEVYPYKRFIVVFAVAIAVAEILHQLVEQPFMRLGRRIVDPEQRARMLASPRLRAALAAVGVAILAVYYRHALLAGIGPRNIALHAAVTASSHEDSRPQSDALTNGELEEEYGLHTKREDHPWAAIDLGSPRRIGAIRIYNRLDGFQDDAVPLELNVSDDGQNFRTIATRDTIFTQAFPWRIRVHGPPVRYVRVTAAKETTLCLSEVEIFEGHGMAVIP